MTTLTHVQAVKALVIFSMMLISAEIAKAQIIDVHVHSYTEDDYWGGQTRWRSYLQI